MVEEEHISFVVIICSNYNFLYQKHIFSELFFTKCPNSLWTLTPLSKPPHEPLIHLIKTLIQGLMAAAAMQDASLLIRRNDGFPCINAFPLLHHANCGRLDHILPCYCHTDPLFESRLFMSEGRWTDDIRGFSHHLDVMISYSVCVA